MLTLLTMTGCRPTAWAICQRLMAKQTYAGPVHWVVVDDGQEAQPVVFARDGWEVEVVRPEPFWAPGQNTQARNILVGLKRVRAGARLIVIEDDDWYGPEHLATMAPLLEAHELVGECRARYYNLERRVWRQLNNTQHASLCSTGMRGAAIQAFQRETEQRHTFIDVHLWRNFRGRKHLYHNPRNVVGLKGLPGRQGIGMGHTPDFAGLRDNSDEVLRNWIGADVELYRWT